MLDGPSLLCRRAFLGGILAISLAAGAAAQSRISVGADKVAIKGYDTVAYFKAGKAVKGRSEFAYKTEDATWLFSSATNRDAFAADPEHYTPQFGGFCAWGMSKGMVVEADPESWTIVDGKLFLKMNHSARDAWRENPAANILAANEYWTKLQSSR